MEASNSKFTRFRHLTNDNNKQKTILLYLKTYIYYQMFTFCGANFFAPGAICGRIGCLGATSGCCFFAKEPGKDPFPENTNA